MLENWLDELGYHWYTTGTYMEVYLHGDYVAHFARFDTRQLWKGRYHTLISSKDILIKHIGAVK